MKQWTFEIRYESRTLTIHGEAVVVGNYDGPSKPEAMVRASLRDLESLRVTLLEEASHSGRQHPYDPRCRCQPCESTAPSAKE